tara:strand:- start:119 stop:1288 length:1170 start_codon:yes stop_codon:yes gene_type:complete
LAFTQLFCTAATHGEHAGVMGLLLLKYALQRVNYTPAAFAQLFSGALQMLIVLDNRFQGQDASTIFATVCIILHRHRVDRRLVPGLVRMVQKRTQPRTADLDTAGCCAVYHAVLRACSVEQLPLVAEGVMQYALVHLSLRTSAAPSDVLRVLMGVLSRVQRSTARACINRQHLAPLFAALAELADAWTQQLLSPTSRASNRYLLVDTLTSLLRLGVEYPQQQLLQVQGLCVGMLALRPCVTLLVKAGHLLLHLCAAARGVDNFLLKETLVARLLRINTRDARIRREVLNMLSYIIDCNGQRCLCTNFTEGVCQQVLLYCMHTAPVPEASALCAYRNAEIVSTIVKSAAHGLHKRSAHSATRAQTLTFFAQLPRAVCDDLGLQPHVVHLL